MKTMFKVILAAGAAGSVLAQDQVEPTQAIRERLDQIAAQRLTTKAGTFEFLTGGLVSGQIIKGAPYSAEAVTETTQTLGDGNRIVQRSSSKQYRDSEGRERQEETSSMGAIFINDPVGKVNYTLHPDTRTAEKGPAPLLGRLNDGKTFYFSSSLAAQRLPEFPTLPGTAAGRGGGRGGVVQGGARSGGPAPTAGTVVAGRGPVFTAGLGNTPEANPANVKEEQLGATQMEGVVAQGTRTTTTIPAGQIGNDRPINVVYERWYSPDLQMTVMTKLNDPRSGETVYKLTNIVRVEQPHSLFEIPSDYAIQDSLTHYMYTIKQQQ
jgi:hypothetical protein